MKSEGRIALVEQEPEWVMMRDILLWRCRKKQGATGSGEDRVTAEVTMKELIDGALFLAMMMAPPLVALNLVWDKRRQG